MDNKSFVLDYLGKYHFYEEEDFLREKEKGDYILENLKRSNRFDYNGASYTFTKYGNISEGVTERGVTLKIIEGDINVDLNGESTHLDLIYKMDVKKLEDHFRVTTRISERGDEVSALLYINLKDGEECIKELEKVKKKQESLRDGSVV